MANRHFSRSLVLQSLFEWDVNNLDKKGALEVLERNALEFAQSRADQPFMSALFTGIMAKQSELDLIIGKAAPDWPIDRIAPIDRNILRLGLYELLFSDRNDVPAKVALNEAIELAKQFGGENSSRFINGVLGAVYKEIGEPGKDDGSKPRRKPTPLEELPVLQMTGALVYAEHEGHIYLALVKDIFGFWTLSKGKLEADETFTAGAVRELKEETGLTITIESELGSNEYISNHPTKGKLRKQVKYFLAKSDYQELVLEEKTGLVEVGWFKVADILELKFYDDILPIVTKAITMLVAKGK